MSRLLSSKKRGKFVVSLANEIVRDLRKYSFKIKIVGSIRRKSKNPHDIDIVLIPKDKKTIFNCLSKKGKFLEGGEKKVSFLIKGVKTEIYYTTVKSWGAALLAYSSKKGSSIGLRVFAKAKGFKLNQYGLFKKGRYIAGKTEKEIYEALGKKYKPASKR